MRKAVVLPLIILMLVLSCGVVTAQASSATVTFAGPTTVKAGGTYTYTYVVNVSSVAAARIVPVTAGGAFELVSGGEGLMYDTIPDNTSGDSDQGTITVRVKDNAKPGDQATLSTSGDYSVLDKDYNQSEHTFSASFFANVASGTAPSSSAAPTATPGTSTKASAAVTPVTESSATPSPTPAETPVPSPSSSPSPSPTPIVVAGTEEDGNSSPSSVMESLDGAADIPAESPNAGQTSVAVIIAVAVAVIAVGAVAAMYVCRVGLFKGRAAVSASQGSGDNLRRADMKKHRRHGR